MMMVHGRATSLNRCLLVAFAHIGSLIEMMIVVQSNICFAFYMRGRRRVHPGHDDRENNRKSDEQNAHVHHLTNKNKNGKIICAPPQ